MIGIFRQKSPANILLLLLFSLFIKAPIFLHPHVPVIHPKDGILFHTILRWMQPVGNNYPALYSLLAFFILFIQALWLNRIMNEQRMMQRQNFLPAMSFMLITSLFPEWNYFSAPLLVNFALLYLIGVSFQMYNQNQGKGAIFNAGLAIGIASFLFFPSVVFFLLALFSLMIMRPFRFNEWVICLLGATMPMYVYGVYLFFIDKLDFQRVLPFLNIKIPALHQTIWIATSTFLVVLPFLIGGYYVQGNLRRVLIQVRKSWSILLIYLLLALFVPFLNTANSFENWVIATIPLATFHSCTYFYPAKKWVPAFIFWLTTAFIIAYQYLGPGWQI